MYMNIMYIIYNYIYRDPSLDTPLGIMELLDVQHKFVTCVVGCNWNPAFFITFWWSNFCSIQCLMHLIK